MARRGAGLTGLTGLTGLNRLDDRFCRGVGPRPGPAMWIAPGITRPLSSLLTKRVRIDRERIQRGARQIPVEIWNPRLAERVAA